MAAFHNGEEFIRKTLPFCKDINTKDHFGLTVSHLIAMHGNLDLIRVLDEQKDDVFFTSQDNDGYNTADIAEKNGKQQVANFLQSKAVIEIVRIFVKNAQKEIIKMDGDTLEELRKKGQSVQKYCVAILRDIHIHIHTALLDLGSGPVVTVSDVETYSRH